MAELQRPELAYQPGTCGVYVHVPFCLKKCSYCSFYSVAGHGKLIDRYVEAILFLTKQEARFGRLDDYRAATFFFGGGTPTILPAEQLVFLLHHLLKLFGCDAGSMEISIEVNPATIDYDGLKCLRRGGFNRLSIGVQSFDDTELAQLGRVHTAADALETISLAKKAGFENLSLDLMYGLPGQGCASWQQTLDQTLALQPDHLSMYELTIESGTEFCALEKAGKLDLPEEDDVLAIMEYTRNTLKHSNLHRYEISNYARTGHACLHNVNYWHNGSYVGYGPGAVSCISGKRTTMLADVERFCARVLSGKSVVTDQEILTREERFRETVIMGLRMLGGVSAGSLEERFSVGPIGYYGETLERLIDQQLIEIRQDNLCLTEQGLLLANTVMSELV